MKETGTSEETVVDTMYKSMMVWLIGPEAFEIKMQTLKELYLKIHDNEYALSKNVQTTALSEGFIEKDNSINITITNIIQKHVKLNDDQLSFF